MLLAYNRNQKQVVVCHYMSLALIKLSKKTIYFMVISVKPLAAFFALTEL